MARASTEQGLIVAANRQVTSALDELIAECGWPALLQATPQRLRRHLLLLPPSVSLFWLDDQSDLAIAMQLLTWLGSYDPRVRRIVVAYRLPADVEVAVRGAGPHWYLAAERDIPALVAGWMPRWLRSEGRLRPTVRPLALDSSTGLPSAFEADLQSSEPP